MQRRRAHQGLSLLEVLLVLAVIGILTGVLLPNSRASVHDQLQAAARVVAADLSYGRSLAVANNDNYRFSFDTANNQYTLQHSGSNSALDTLPPSPFRSSSDTSTKQVVRLGELPLVGPTVTLLVACTSGMSPQRITSVEFGPLGGTTSSAAATIWLSCGGIGNQGYIWLQVDPVTGMVDVGPYTSQGPPDWLVGSGT